MLERPRKASAQLPHSRVVTAILRYLLTMIATISESSGERDPYS
jgi:hypothetical protein